MKINKIKGEDIAKIKSDPVLFQKIVTVNDNFFNKLVQKIKGVDSELFQDLKQEAIIAFWDSLDKFDTTRNATFSTFVYTCINNRLLHTIKKSNKTSSKEVSLENFVKRSDDSDQASEYYENYFKNFLSNQDSTEQGIIRRLDYEKAMNKLSDMDKKILNFKKAGLTREQIAKKLGMNVHTYKFYYYGTFVKRIKAVFDDLDINKKRRTKNVGKY